MNQRIRNLKEKIDFLEDLLASEKLLEEIWIELGPYTPHLSSELVRKLRHRFEFDDSE